MSRVTPMVLTTDDGGTAACVMSMPSLPARSDSADWWSEHAR